MKNLSTVVYSSICMKMRRVASSEIRRMLRVTHTLKPLSSEIQWVGWDLMPLIEEEGLRGMVEVSVRVSNTQSLSAECRSKLARFTNSRMQANLKLFNWFTRLSLVYQHWSHPTRCSYMGTRDRPWCAVGNQVDHTGGHEIAYAVGNDHIKSMKNRTIMLKTFQPKINAIQNSSRHVW
jgi:hypothetical protein